MLKIDDRIRRSVEAHAAEGNSATMCCMPVSQSLRYFDDDAICECSRCGTLVRYRPYVPEHWEKLCIDCMGADVASAVRQRLAKDRKRGKK